MVEKLKKTPAKKEYYISPSNLGLIEACIKGNSAALLIGETGVGKTTVIRELAKERNKELVRISVNGSMGIEEILGKFLVKNGTTYWQDGILTAALRNGYWVVMDEINAALPEVLFVLHSLLDDDRKIVLPEKDNEVVRPHEEFRFFATMNPPEEYAGTKDMNKALMSRFTAVINVPVLKTTEEIELLVQKGADKKTALNLVSLAQKLRDSKKKDYIFYFCSTRDLVQAAQLIAAGLSYEDALLGSVINKMTTKEYDVVKTAFPPLKISDAVADMSVEQMLKIVEGHDQEIKTIKEGHVFEIEARNAMIRKLEDDLKKGLQAKDDSLRDDLLQNLRQVVKRP